MLDITAFDIKYVPGVGPQRAFLLNKELNIYSLHDFFYYFPYKYIDRSHLYTIREIDGNMPFIQLKGQILSFETMGPYLLQEGFIHRTPKSKTRLRPPFKLP